MLRRRTASPYFVCSFFIHFVLLLVIWQFVPKEVALPPLRKKIEALITHVKPLQPPVKPPVFVEPAPIVAQEEKPPAPPKPKAGLRASWQMTDQDAAAPEAEIRRQDSANHTRKLGDRLPHLGSVGGKATYTPENLLTVNSLAQPIAAESLASKIDYVAPQGETQPIALAADAGLDGSSASPGIEAPKIHYGSERGDALKAGGMGNSWGAAALLEVRMWEVFSSI